MSNDDERDYEEERYNRELCPECDYSPCILKQGETHETDKCLFCGEVHDQYDHFN